MCRVGSHTQPACTKPCQVAPRRFVEVKIQQMITAKFHVKRRANGDPNKVCEPSFHVKRAPGTRARVHAFEPGPGHRLVAYEKAQAGGTQL